MIRIIVATDSDGGIAKHGIQPWSIPDDEQYFQAQTLKFGGAILMGHKTYETIGSALPNRHNYVASRAPLHEANIEQVTDIANFLTHYKDGQDLWVIGGAAIYEQSLASADELYITEIAAHFGCDVFFEYPAAEFSLQQQSELHNQNGFSYTFNIYKRA